MSYKIEFVIDWYNKNKEEIPKMYSVVKIPKRNGKLRTLEIPDPILSSMQRVIKDELLTRKICSKYAEAYQKRIRIRTVANKHRYKQLLLKLDIKDFFGHITVDLIKRKVFGSDEESLAELCCCNGHLPQGACTSPVISNLVMRDFDNELGEFCRERSIRYSRYSDDLIFSGDFNPGLIIRKAKEMLRSLGMEINNEKTVIASCGSQQKVLGVVVNEKLQLPSEYRRKIRQEVFYCNKYGVLNHILKSNAEKYIVRDEKNDVLYVDTKGYLRALVGKIKYALHINPNDLKMAKYYETVQSLLKSENRSDEQS